MFCPNCGAESTQGLNYCKRCGGSLGATAQAGAAEGRPGPAVGTSWAVAVTMLLLVVMGLGILLGMIRDLVHTGLPVEAVVLIMICGSLTLLGSVFMLTRFWSRLLGVGAPPAAAPAALAGRTSHTNELAPPTHAGALPDAPAHSVTEQTTRTLEHAHKKY